MRTREGRERAKAKQRREKLRAEREREAVLLQQLRDMFPADTRCLVLKVKLSV